MIMSILKWSVITVVLAVLWIAFLWFGMTPDWGYWNPLHVIALHALPPIGLVSSALLLKWISKKQEAKAEKAKEEQQTLAKQKEQAAAEQERSAEQAKRRFSAPIVAIAQSATQPLRDAMTEAFAGLYRQAELAASLPVIVHSSEPVQAEWMTQILTDCRIAVAKMLGTNSGKLSFSTADGEQALID